MSTLSPEILKKIKHVHLEMEHVATDLLAGLYRSAFKGRGMEFDEVREYVPGDDVRTIDWNVTARMDHPYIKQFKEERELTVMLIVDVSASTFFGSRAYQKKTMLAEIAALLAFSAIKNHDKVGLLLFSDKIVRYLAPKKGTKHVLRLIRELLAPTIQPGITDLAQALAYFGKVQKGKTVCFILSDFFCAPFYKQAAPLAKKHDMIAICTRDPIETNMPAIGLLHTFDEEKQEKQIIDTSAHLEEYRKIFLHETEELKHTLEEMGMGWIPIETSDSYVAQLRKFFKKKKRK